MHDIKIIRKNPDLFKKKISEHINHNIDFQSLSVKDEDLFDNVLSFLQEIKETS